MKDRVRDKIFDKCLPDVFKRTQTRYSTTNYFNYFSDLHKQMQVLTHDALYATLEKKK